MTCIGIKVNRLRSYHLSLTLLGLVMCGVFLVIQGCGGPPMEPWHTEKLTEEFTADMVNKIQTFDDYRKLEDRLFQQLEEKIYPRTATGPEYELVRYSAGSAADPQQRQPNWNRSFEFTADQPVGGVLLLHGMSDSPYSLRVLGQTLKQRNFWVIGLRLPGHGTAPSGLKTIHWQDMAAAVRLAVAHLASKIGKKPIHLVGYSNGAPLALNYALDALENDNLTVPASLVLISPSIGLHPAAALAKWKRRLSILPGLGGMAWLSVMPEFDPYKYNSFATNAGEQVHGLTRAVARRLAARAGSDAKPILPPTLVFKSTVDATVSEDAVVDRLLKHLRPNRHELVLFDINRFAAKSSLLIADPAPFTARLTADKSLPFALTLVTNANPESRTAVAHYKPSFSTAASKTEALHLAWPQGVISLSHVALPFAPDDPLYGQGPPAKENALFLGQMAIQGERDLLKIPYSFLLRIRYNPFYVYLERRVLEWFEKADKN
ncbi:MAG: alpha/beta hydrolase [Deltaproteobacteria bacterium]|nr:alpha/beta hydrolase [Deltaproteobacteria bacterium]